MWHTLWQALYRRASKYEGFKMLLAIIMQLVVILLIVASLALVVQFSIPAVIGGICVYLVSTWLLTSFVEKKCPFCDSSISKKASKCPKCQSELPANR